jgi:hypothetical protein
VRLAYADPPYLGMCARYDHYHPDGRCWDDLETHRLLIDRLVGEFPDGWALSASSPSLRDLLPLTPPDCRVGPWVKPFASYKKGVNPGYAWEPVIFRGGRRRTDGTEPTVSDYVSVPITLQTGTVGAKPPQFTWWVMGLLGVQQDDEVADLFPGSGDVGRAIDAWQRQAVLGLVG